MSKVTRAVERMRNVPGLLRDVVAIVVCGVVATSCTVYILAHQGIRSPLAQRYEFSAVFDMAPGVRPQSQQEVRIAGVSVGRISEAEPDEDGHARITMSLEPGHTVYTNAQLVLRAKSPLNPMYVTLVPGGSPAQPLPEGGTIPLTQTQRAIQSFEILDKLDGRVQAAVTSLLNNADVALAKAPRDLPKALEQTRMTAATFEPVMTSLATREAKIRELVTAFSEMSRAVGANDQRLASLVASVQTTLSVIGTRDEALSATLERLPGFADALSTSMDKTTKLTAELNPTLDNLISASGTLPGALTRLTSTVQSARRLAIDGRPAIAAARSVVSDLRPFVSDVNGALADLGPVVGYLPSATAKIIPWMDDLAAFVYQTSSAFSLSDVNGGMGRANVNLDITNPAGGLADQGLNVEGQDNR